jgi:hypothetical protein
LIKIIIKNTSQERIKEKRLLLSAGAMSWDYLTREQKIRNLPQVLGDFVE